MSDNTVDLVSDYEVETSSASVTGTSPNSHLPFFDINHLELDVITLLGDYDSEKVSENFSEEETYSFGSLDALISNVWGIINHVDAPIPPRILSKEEVITNLRRRERPKDFLQVRL